MNITFDYDERKKKLHVQTSKDDLDLIRHEFSAVNETYYIQKARGRGAPRRNHTITTTGRCDIGFLWLIRQYLTKSEYVCDITYTDSLKKVVDIGRDSTDLTKLKLDLRYYQEEVVKLGVKHGRGTMVLATGAGKTLMIASLIAECYKHHDSSAPFKCLIIVPDLGLVTQTAKDFEEYEVPYTFSKWTGKNEIDTTTDIVICNAAIINNRLNEQEWCKYVDLVIVDECHKIKKGNTISDTIDKLLTLNKYGFTGTLPDNSLDYWGVIGKFGPVLYEKNSSTLRDEGFLANVGVSMLRIDYLLPPKYTSTDKYKEELEYVYNSEYRIGVIKALANNLKNNTLILVNHLDHGAAIYNALQGMEGKEVYYIIGEVEVEVREQIKARMEEADNIVCVAISKIFSTGVNVKNLHNIIFAMAGKAFIRTVQSIGRGLRLHPTKDKLRIYDVYDNLRYSLLHADKRKQIYNKENIEYTSNIIVEKM